MSEIGLGNLYEFNKTAIREFKPLKGMILANEIEKVKKDLNYGTYTLLCRERYDFTMFRITESIAIAGKELVDILSNRGDILNFDRQDDGSYEIWIKDANNEIFMYKFFSCDWLIEC